MRGASRLTPNKSLVGKMRPAKKNYATLFHLFMRGNDIMRKLSAHPYAQCEIIIAPAYAACKSYNTIVATIDEGWLTIHGLYSQTTRRHIGAFVKEYANLSYQIARMLYEDRCKYNIYTGEVCPI